MLFKAELARKIFVGEKTQTCRIKKGGEYYTGFVTRDERWGKIELRRIDSEYPERKFRLCVKNLDQKTNLRVIRDDIDFSMAREYSSVALLAKEWNGITGATLKEPPMSSLFRYPFYVLTRGFAEVGRLEFVNTGNFSVYSLLVTIEAV